MKRLAIVAVAGALLSAPASAQQADTRDRYRDRDHVWHHVTQQSKALRAGDPDPYATRAGAPDAYAPRAGAPNPYATQGGTPNPYATRGGDPVPPVTRAGAPRR